MHSVSQLVTEEFNMPVDTFQVILEIIFPVNHMIDAKKFPIHRCGGLLFCCIVENNTLSFSIAFLARILIYQARNRPADKILAKFINPRLRYHYFRFLETNEHLVGILLPVLSFIFTSSPACPSVSAKQISLKCDHPRWNYHVIYIAQDNVHLTSLVLN